jgi:hypothetical protein
MKRAFLAATSAVALLVFDAPQASATHVQCGATITASTTLDSDVVCPDFASVGVVIGADNVTLRLAGHTIQSVAGGSGIFTQHAVTNGPVSGVEIRGGTIVGFGFATQLRGSNNSVQGLRFDSTILFEGGPNNRAILNEQVGAATGGGIGFSGFQFVAPDNAYATRNTVYAIGTFGDNPRIVVNQVNCIDVRDYRTSAVIARNTVTGCQDDGITVAPFGASSGGSSSDGASVRRNLVTGSTPFGINVDDPGSRVWCNTANGNGEGIRLQRSGNLVDENTANNNTGFGINAPAGTIDGGGNAATGNGTNCVNVACGTTSTCTRSVGAGG